MKPEYDLILIGCGLANGLIAWRLLETRPDVRFLVLEKDNRFGGPRTWSFHDSDITDSDRAWVRPLVTRSWVGHSVCFPGYRRELAGHYHSIRAETFYGKLVPALGNRLRVGSAIASLSGDEVFLADGRKISAGCVIDGRGLHGVRKGAVAYQKFLGLDLRLARPHGLLSPCLMDATVPQKDGYRFLYVLPWSETTLLVEDTRYSDSPDLDRAEYRGEIRAYAKAQGWEIVAEEREEEGALPIPLDPSFATGGSPVMMMAASGVVAAGTRAGWFHPTTGYSFPDAVRWAGRFAAMEKFESTALLPRLVRESRRLDRRRGFYRFLNRMMFRGAAPGERYRILQRFYMLPEPTIARFYAGTLELLDYARILVGKPPIPVARAVQCLWPARVEGMP